MDYKYGFKISRKGYDTAEVDTYIDELIERMTAMQEQNAALFARLGEAQDMIRRYSETEKNLRSSIAESKRAAADMLDVARVRSANLVNAAREECNRIVDELDRQIETKYKTIDTIRNNVLAFKTELFTLYSDHIEMVDNLCETANNFEYDPDFSTLSEAIEEFEAAGEIEAPEAPEFPEVPEESFFAEKEEPVENAPAYENLEVPAAEEAAEEADEGDTVDVGELTFGFEEISETEAEVPELSQADENEALTEAAEEELFFGVEDSAEAKDEMFDRNDGDEHLFNFLKDFVNGSEE